MKLRSLLSLSLISMGLLGLGAVGCKPQTTSQKVENKVEDAQHEMKQGVERTKENVDNATSK